jgi:uracil-DNA glycosylase
VLTGRILAAVQARAEPVVFLLWGRHAQEFQPAPDAAPNGASRLVLTANHPSPLSARRPPVPFMGCGHFAQANDFLRQHGVAPVDW